MIDKLSFRVCDFHLQDVGLIQESLTIALRLVASCLITPSPALVATVRATGMQSSKQNKSRRQKSGRKSAENRE